MNHTQTSGSSSTGHDGYNGPDSDVRQKYVPERIDVMDSALGHLLERVDTLEHALLPVLRPLDNEGGDADAESKTHLPPLAAELDALSDAIYAAINKLEGILNRLEV